MIRLKKIYLENFKGVKIPHSVSLDSDSSILMGPNGFGKTTIFDALELCITKTIHRTENTKVTKDSKDYSKPFFQNEKDKDVTIKVWLTNDIGEDLVIVRYYKHDKIYMPPGKKFKPSDFDSLFDLYTQNPEDFDNPVIYKQLIKMSEEKINDFFELNNQEVDIANIFKLFVYLQQEETTFFLKQDEGKRKTSLGFLFESAVQEEKKLQLMSQIKFIDKAIKDLKEKKKKLSKVSLNYNSKYERLFTWGEAKQFDQIEPFKNIDTDSLTDIKVKMTDDLVKIEEFITSFSPVEYQKKENDNYFLTKVNDIELCKSLVLKNFLNHQDYLTKQQYRESILSNNDYPTRIAIMLAGIDLSKITKEADDYKFLENMIEKKDVLLKFDIDVLVKYLKMSGLEEKDITHFKILMNNKTSQENNLDLTNKKISEINQTRNELKNKHLSENAIISEDICPYCGNDWGLVEKLETAYEELTERMIMENQKSHLLIQNIIDEINKIYFAHANSFAKKRLQELNPIPDVLIRTIENNLNKNLNTLYYDEMVKGLSNEVKAISRQDITTQESFNDNVTKIWKILQDQWLESKEFILTLEKIKNKDYSKQLKFLKINFIEEDFTKYEYPFESKVDVSKINTLVDKLYDRLQILRLNFKYNTSAAQDTNNLYDIIFCKSKDNFDKVKHDKIKEKKLYIEKQFAIETNRKLNQINERISFLDKAFTDSKKVCDTYKNQIDDYKQNMVQVLKVPFFILTGKILQNYQQGMGVFLTSNASGGIKFITDQTSDHDAMHHLSTGQIAVISIAFTLACKKCYNAAKQIDFLIIDDPIQDMDALNIQAFIDVLRRNFLNENQIILSTHSDSSAALIKYKFDRFIHDNNTRFIDVQNEFFGEQLQR